MVEFSSDFFRIILPVTKTKNILFVTKKSVSMNVQYQSLHVKTKFHFIMHILLNLIRFINLMKD